MNKKCDKIYLIILVTFFIMKKTLITSFLLLQTLTLNAANLWNKEIETTKQNTSIITNFFTTEMLLNFVFAVIVIILTFAISKSISHRLTRSLEKNLGETGWNREELVWVVSRTSNIAVLFIWFSIALTILWVDTAIFMWWIWFWLGFTMKTFLSNFISWIMMVTQWEYHNWDLVQVDWVTWTIKRINSLYTSIEKFDWITFHIPNVKFMEENVSNYNTNDKRRTEIDLLVEYDTDIIKTKKVVNLVLENFPNILKAPESDIIIDKLDNSWILVKVRYWTYSKDDFFHTRSNVTETINLAFKKQNINFAYPHLKLINK